MRYGLYYKALFAVLYCVDNQIVATNIFALRKKGIEQEQKISVFFGLNVWQVGLFLIYGKLLPLTPVSG